ncbi:serine hydrolase domain-containing protein [Amycolatopsis roodepoortensis]|uniref:CubicO group peptidase (Beta-lactamase class C family) n=1 Tax=Amycolatopsis roodepoortensis TaxID=700274 RepID=A0ABR9KY31_9PSEU|nr:serine hydrolase [Amycolatopsis roodepoortensis]MBE1573275.1 CubicO group peptidase (beta-lactamase class C family) [Amycolatopsis roodepoortensis]
MALDLPAVHAAAAAQAERVTPGIGDMNAYLASQVKERSHREVLGPLLPASGASGVILHRGERIAAWGDPETPEMAFSVTKSVVSIVAGVAFDQGLLPDPHRPVADTVDLPELAGTSVTWHHLLQQTSEWNGYLWGKPSWLDGPRRDGTPGSAWEYNDVRVNLLCLALTHLFARSLPSVLDEHVLGPLGASDTWSWHGYRNSLTTIGDETVPVVSGGAHWGGGLWISAADLALLCPRDGLLSESWIERSWTPCPLKPDYGYLWWLNPFPSTPSTGRAARGNADQHMLWVDPSRDLVIVSRWGRGVEELVRAVSEAVPVVG